MIKKSFSSSLNNDCYKITATLISACLLTLASSGQEIHVSIHTGNDNNDGSEKKPLKTISAAALKAYPGNTITVHEGIYREEINPPRGGISDTKRIVYRAAKNEKVAIKGSEIIRHWKPVQHNTWKATIPNHFFGYFNPYSDTIHGDWFWPRKRTHHTGAVYLNGHWLIEAATLQAVLTPVQNEQPLWFASVDKDSTTIYAQLNTTNPNAGNVEINVRQTVFYPKKTGINYITVQGFKLSQAATPWAPPTAEQKALIGTNWSKGWIIENNEITYSTCSGLSLGKHGDEFDNTSADAAEGYVKTIERALQYGWSSENIGHHLVSNNHIAHCEQTGIVGSMGCSFSTITGNTIHDIHTINIFDGAEMAGIKFHGAIDVVISHNYIYHNNRGLWLDWMAQGAIVMNNLMNDNYSQDIFLEVNHGPTLVANNILLSKQAIDNQSNGVAFVHNLIAGNLNIRADNVRQTPFLLPHATGIAGFTNTPIGDDRWFNNIFIGQANLSVYNASKLLNQFEGNVYLENAKPPVQETAAVLLPNYEPAFQLSRKADGIYLEFNFDKNWQKATKRKLVNTKALGKAVFPNQFFELPNGQALQIDKDYFEQQRNRSNPFPGPFEIEKNGQQLLKVWSSE